jgi:hypothetical protein
VSSKGCMLPHFTQAPARSPSPRSRAPNRQAAPSLPNSRPGQGTHWWRALLRAGRAEECEGLGTARDKNRMRHRPTVEMAEMPNLHFKEMVFNGPMLT